MAYSDPQEMTASRVAVLGFVTLAQVLLGYGIVKALTSDGTRQVFEELTTFDVQEEAPEPEKPPPPPEKVDIPPPPKVTLPPPVNRPPVVDQVQVQVAPPPAITPQAAPAPPPPPPPPPPPAVAQKAVQKGGSITNDDYPPGAQRAKESGVSVARFTIGTDGRVTDCNASGASPSLDAETCKLIMKRFKFKPALDTGGSPIAEARTQRVRWQLPDE